MKRFNIEWHTHNNTAGGIGSVDAEDVDKAKEEARKVIAEHNPLLTEEEISKLVIEATEA